MELFRNMLGGVNDMGYGCKLPIQYLIEREPMSNNASPVLEPLIYARLTYFSESDKSEQLRVSKKKKLTSHEPINVRPLYGKQQNIMHKSNFVLQTNYALSIDSTDHGTWRRERYYTMKIKFCTNPDPKNKYEKKKDPTFTDEKTRDPEYLSGILSILTMYLGILDMKYGGVLDRVPCPTITRETETFRNSQDVINRFITERIVITADAEHELSFTDLVDSYCQWYDHAVRERRHDRLDISLMFKNSRLSGSVFKKVNGAYCVRSHRVLGPEEEKEEDERFILQREQEIADEYEAKAVDDVVGVPRNSDGDNELDETVAHINKTEKPAHPVYESSNTALQRQFDLYTALAKERHVGHW
jgi:phage/plasmid-associated DNA primase